MRTVLFATLLALVSLSVASAASDRMGNDDVFAVPVAGGIPRQVTFHSTGDAVLYWTPGGQRIVFATSRGAHPFFSPLYTVSPLGDVPLPMDMDQGAAGVTWQDSIRVR